MVNILDRNNYDVLSKIDILLVCPEAFCAQPRSVCLNIDNKRVLVGTKGSEIYEFSCQESKLSEKTNWSFKNLIKGHYCPNTRSTN